MTKALYEIQLDAERLRRDGNLAAAIEQYERLLESDPTWSNGAGYYALAETYEQAGRINEARAAFEKAIEYNNDPPNALFLSNYGGFLLQHGAAAEAFEWFLRGIRVAAEQKLPSVASDLAENARLAAAGAHISSSIAESQIQKALVAAHR